MTTAYLRSHPWLTFSLEMEKAPNHFWIKLGEARSKCEHIAGVPLRPDFAAEIHRLFLAKGALATTAIEGNTLSEEEAQKIVDGTLELPPSREYMGKEIENILEAFNGILKEVAKADGTGKRKLTPARIREFNGLVLRGLEVEKDVVPGQYRLHRVGVARYRAVDPQDCEELIQRLCDWLEGPDFKPSDEDYKCESAIIKAIVAHLYLAWIHPFGDGNGRTARLVEFQILVDAGLPVPASLILSNHYNMTRSEYYSQLDRASQAGGDVIPFLIYAVTGFVDGLREQLSHIRRHQMDVAWINYIHEAFQGMAHTDTADRQRRLVLDLSTHTEPVRDLRDVSPRMARTYAQKAERTLARDIRELIGLDLIELGPGGYRAKREKINAFVPFTAPPEKS